MNSSDPFSNFEDDKTIIRPSPGGRLRQAPEQTASPAALDPVHNELDGGQFKACAQEGSNPLITSSFSLLSLVPKLRNLTYHHAIDELRENLVSEIKSFENSSVEKGAPPNHVDTAKYFLCSLMDEAVLNTPWGGQSGWGHNSLSSQFFRKIMGGEEFFQTLDRLKNHPAQNLNLLEFAYLCLSLGFEGKHRFSSDGLHALENERQDLYMLIQRIKGDSQPELSQDWQGLKDLKTPFSKFLPFWVCAMVVLVLLMLVFSLYKYPIHEKSERIYSDLADLSGKVKKYKQIPPITLQQSPPATADRFRKILADEISQKKVEVINGPILRIFDLFPSGSVKVKKESHGMLEKITKEVQKDESIIEVIGHTDSQRLKFSSRFKSNWDLSNSRAENVAAILNDNDLLGKRISFQGRGDSEPIAPNDTKANRARNRRIDIKIHVR